MSLIPSDGPSPIDLIIEPVTKDLGSFQVRRALPHPSRAMVGPFIFFDHMGPSILPPGHGMDVRPHPHIGLSTVTYLAEGSIFHRDSLGTEQEILPGAVNLMTAGRGIVHSERTAPETRASGQTIQGLQTWLALPRASEETDPGFAHHPVPSLPEITDGGARLRLIAGEMAGAVSPVATASPTIYGDVTLDAGATVPFGAEYAERACYILYGAVTIGPDTHGAHKLLVLRPGDPITLRATGPSRVLLFGGEPMDGPRHIFWNFVSSRPDRIEAAKTDWRAGCFATVPGDDQEFIPLP